MTRILLKNGEIVRSDGVFEQDVLIDGGEIARVMHRGEECGEVDEEIDCSGKVILPGLIDAHVHFRDFDEAYKADWESESKAAVAGGITTVLDMPNNKPAVVSVAALEKKRARIAGRSFVNYGLFMGYDGKNIDEIRAAENIAGVKVYVANSTGNMGVGSGGLEEVLRETDKLVVVHAEDEGIIAENEKRYLSEFEGRDVDPAVHSKIRSVEAAVSAVRGVCDLAKDYQGRIHVAHVSCEDEVELIGAARKFGVTCEVSPHHLSLSEDDYEVLGTFAKVNPPVRSRSDVFAMWKDLKFGVIDIIATDHAPHTIEEKEQDYRCAPGGIPEEDTLLPFLLNAVNDEGMSLEDIAVLCCERPAEIFGIEGKGRIEEGYDADLVVVHMDEERKVEDKDLLTKCGWSPYAGSVFKGWPVMTFVGGKLVFDGGEFVAPPSGAGGEEVEFLV